MDLLEVFKNVVGEFDDEELAIVVVSMMSIHLSTKCRTKDLKKRGNYTKRLERKMRALLWSHQEKYPLALRIWAEYYDYEICQSMHGLGGCVKKTLKQLIKERPIEKNSDFVGVELDSLQDS